MTIIILLLLFMLYSIYDLLYYFYSPNSHFLERSPVAICPVRCRNRSMASIDAVDAVERGKTSYGCLLYTSPSPRDKRQSRMPSSA